MRGWIGLDTVSWTRGHLARATVEGLLCALADCLDALVAEGAHVDRVLSKPPRLQDLRATLRELISA